jgi:transposase
MPAMFIRCVTKRDKNTQQTYHTYKLVESYRTARGPRQRVLLHLGNTLDLSSEHWKRLANRIEEICTGINRLCPYPDDIERLAQQFAKLLIRKQSITYSEIHVEAVTKKRKYVSIDLASLSTSNSRSIGVEHVLYETFKRLNLHKFLQKLGFNKAQIGYAAAAIIGRAAFPASELRTHFYLQHRSAIDELMGADFSDLPLIKLYQISDLLLANKHEIETHLEAQEKQLFELDETIILYDITNTYFEGTSKANPKAKYGPSKEKRRDCPLVSAGLVLNKQGFVKRSEFLEGNIIETKAFAEAIIKLHGQGNFLTKPVVVIDAGMASQANIDWLKQHGYHYLTVFRKKRRELPEGGEWVDVKTTNDNVVRAYIAECPELGERHLYCHSTARARREHSIKTKIQNSFEAELNQLDEGLLKPRRMKKYDVILEKIGKLKQKYKRIARFYNIEVDSDGHGNANKITYSYQSDKMNTEFNGSYCLRTDITQLSAKELWDIYMMLSNAEEAFRDMKSHLGLRPIFHSKEARIDGHMWITLLAYHLVHSITHQLRTHNISLSWSSIRDRLSSQARVTTSTRCEDGTIVHIRTTTEPEEFVKEIYCGLGMLQLPLGRTIAKM